MGNIYILFLDKHHNHTYHHQYIEIILPVFLGLVTILGLSACSDADVASRNVSKEAEQFRVRRRIVFYNSLQDVYILQIEGNCSIELTDEYNMLEVICKIGKDTYQKHFLGLSDNVTYSVEQLDFSEVSQYRYEIIFKPEVIIPLITD